MEENKYKYLMQTLKTHAQDPRKHSQDRLFSFANNYHWIQTISEERECKAMHDLTAYLQHKKLIFNFNAVYKQLIWK